MAMNAQQSASLIALAREKKLFLMECMWTRFFPSIHFVRKLLADNEIGKVRNDHAEIDYPFPKDEARPWRTAIQSKQLQADEYESLGIMTIMDKIREDMGIVYPADTDSYRYM